MLVLRLSLALGYDSYFCVHELWTTTFANVPPSLEEGEKIGGHNGYTTPLHL